MFFQLGSRIYDGMKSFVSFDEESESIVVEYALIGRKPRLQGVANGLTTINLSFFFHQEFCVVKDEIAALKNSKDNYEVLPLLAGTGEVFGEFVIVQLSISRVQMDDLGNTVAAEVSLSMKENVVDNKQAQLQQTAVKNAFAVGDKKPVKTGRTNQPSCNKKVSAYVSSISSNGAVVNKFVNSYSSYFNPTGCIKNLQVIYQQLSALYSSLNNGGLPCINNASNVQGICNTAMSNDTTLQNLLRNNFLTPIPDKPNIQSTNLSLQTNIGQLKSILSKNITASILNK